jgi:hypothetical protein
MTLGTCSADCFPLSGAASAWLRLLFSDNPDGQLSGAVTGRADEGCPAAELPA